MYNFGFICLNGVASFVKMLQKNAFFVTFANPDFLVQIHDNQAGFIKGKACRA